MLGRPDPVATAGAIARLTGELTVAAAEVEDARRRLAAALRVECDLTARIAGERSGEGAHCVTELLTVVGEVEQILRLAFVRGVRIVRERGAPGLQVTTHALVVGRSRDARWMGSLTFVLRWNPVGLWFRTGGSPPHPHVHTSGEPCYGGVRASILEPLSRCELLAATLHVGAFLRCVDPSDTVRRLEAFPATPLAPGWHPHGDRAFG